MEVYFAEKVCRGGYEKEYYSLQEGITKVVSGTGATHNTVLTDYFVNPHSEALYLIPELYIKIVVEKELCNNNMLSIVAKDGTMPCNYAMEKLNKYSANQSMNEKIFFL